MTMKDEVLLSAWKQQLDRDADTLKMKGNLNSLRTVRACNLSFTCSLIILLLIILAVAFKWKPNILNCLVFKSFDISAFL